NFGDILAGYIAKRMGLPVEELAIATNANDILDRFVKSGRYEKDEAAGVKETLAPAMDILVSSNFERLLWWLALEAEGAAVNNEEPAEEKKKAAGETVKRWMVELKSTGKTEVPQSV